VDICIPSIVDQLTAKLGLKVTYTILFARFTGSSEIDRMKAIQAAPFYGVPKQHIGGVVGREFSVHTHIPTEDDPSVQQK
jgi:hypothetical protein